MANNEPTSSLRQRAEDIAGEKGGQTADAIEALSPEETQRILHELRVHQFELEMQNEELRRTQVELDAERARYFDLYDHAPVGYCTLSEDGLILESNLTAARLLGLAQGDVVQHSILRFVIEEDRGICYLCIKKLFKTGEQQGCEMRMLKKDGAVFWVCLEGSIVESADGAPFCRVAMSDITERKRVETTLRESEDRYRTLFDRANDGIFILSDDGKLVSVNESFAYMHGYRVKEMLNMSMIDLTTPETSILLPERMRRLLKGESLTFDVEHYHKDGHIFPLEVSSSLILSGGKAFIQGFHRDIAERKASDKSLREVQRRMTTLLGNLPGMAYRCRNDRHWTMEFVSDGCLPLTSYSAADLTDNAKLSYSDIIHPEDRKGVWADVQTALDQERRFELTYRIQTAGGETKWVWEQGMGVFSTGGALVALEGFIIDITAQKTALATMAKYLQLSEHTRDIILFVRLEDGRIVEANQAACAAYGCERDELLAKTIYDLRVDGPGMVIRHMEQASQTPHLFETIHKRRDGLIFPVEVRSCAAQINGETLLLSVIRDITERKRVENAVRESLHEKESLLKEIHHRVKNNLQIVSSLLRLQSGQIEHPSARAAMQEMQNRVHSMALIHEHLYRSENLAQVDMAAYFKSLCPKLMHTLAARPEAIRLHLDLIPVYLEIDQALPCGLLVNELVSNALKHAFPEGRTGEVRLELRPVDDGRQIHLRVSDNGVGLPADFDMQRLSSLGLELASDLATQIKGRLEIGPGPGATFDVVFAPVNRMNSTRKSADTEIRRKENE